jgi:hypothetical protein
VGIGDHDVQIPVIVYIGKLSASAAEPAVAIGKAFVGRKAESSLIHKKLEPFIRKNK